MIKQYKHFAFLLLLFMYGSVFGQNFEPFGYIVKTKNEKGVAYLNDKFKEVNTFEPVSVGKELFLLSTTEVSLSKIKTIETDDNIASIDIVYKHKSKPIFYGNLNKVFIKTTTVESIDKVVQEFDKITYNEGLIQDVYELNIQDYSFLKRKEIVQSLRANKSFDYVNLNAFFTPSVESNDPFYTQQWYIKNNGGPPYGGTQDADLDVDEAWAITKGSESIKIGLLDSGVDTNHIDLNGRLLKGYDPATDSTEGYPTPTYSSDGHGTCCSGIMCATGDNNEGISGIAPNCKLIPVRIFYYINYSGYIIPYSTTEIMSDGINWIYSRADLVSNSWGVDDDLINFSGIDTNYVSQMIIHAVKNGRDGKGLPMLFSAGNYPIDSVIWPSRLSQTIAVTGTNVNDDLINSYNRGKWLDIAAPGEGIFATDMMGSNGYTNGNYYSAFNGTSSACPAAAGVMALVLSANPDLSAHDARYILQTTTDKVGGYNYDKSKTYGGWSHELGYGRLNAFKAVSLATNFIQAKSENQVFALYNIYNSYGDIKIDLYAYEVSTYNVKIYSMSGAMLYNGDYEGLYGTQSLSIPSQQSINQGLYVVKITSNNQVATKKVVLYN